MQQIKTFFCIPEDAKEILKEEFENSLNKDMKFEISERSEASSVIRVEINTEDLPFTFLDLFWAGYKYAKKTYKL
jgi:hypothetical protein